MKMLKFDKRKGRRRQKRTPAPKPRSAVRKRNAKRRKREFERAYGSAARVEWLKHQACAACGFAGHDSEVAHIRTGGMGRKADKQFTIPLCTSCYRPSLNLQMGLYGVWEYVEGCHARLHRVGVETFMQGAVFSLEQIAKLTEDSWQAHSQKENR